MRTQDRDVPDWDALVDFEWDSLTSVREAFCEALEVHPFIVHTHITAPRAGVPM